MACSHFTEAKTAENSKLLKNLETICRNAIFCSSDALRKQKYSWSKCFDCERRKPFVCFCLECFYAGCLTNGHFSAHCKQTQHRYGVDITFGRLYCIECKEFVYDVRAEEIRTEAENERRKSLGLSLTSRWNPDSAEVDLLKSGSHRALRVSAQSTLGLRGLLNLGNTCFMNCILQAFTHTPLLRDYFLSDQHRCALTIGDECVMCEMSRIFQEFYGGEKKAHVPYKMLYLVWTHARHLAGYEQQDAHEFFIATLDVLHRHSRSSTVATNQHQCKCIIDRIFTGRLQSDVTCQTCKSVSTTVDPYWDISLDLGTTSPHMVDTEVELPGTLDECLNGFTRPEHLGKAVKCSNCDSYEDSTKQLSLKKLPIVACFHLKRFEHCSRLHKKISTFISFPQYLDLTQFTSDFRSRKSKEATDVGSESESSGPDTQNTGEKLERLRNKYALFAVVNHIGTLDCGHYTCYVRQKDEEWFKCDDHIITKASIDEVLASEGYLLFYHKQFLDYD